jgi:hypothetical protein
MAMMQTLSATGWRQAREFMRTQARPIEWAAFQQRFENGSVEAVLAELVKFQNPDGGFGHGSEPDLRTPDSSAIATSHRLQLMGELTVPPDHEMVRRAMDYLRATCDRQNHVWPIIPLTAGNAPHAPWWSTKDRAKSWNGFRANPTAEIAGYLFVFGTPADEPLRAAVLRGGLDYLTTRQPDMHELLCYVRLAEMVPLPVIARDALRRAVCDMVERDPAKWPKYGLRPLSVVQSPASPDYGKLRAAVEANLDFLIGEQTVDGSWVPTWSWGDAFPDVWPIARRDWQGILTLEALTRLRAFGRVEKPKTGEYEPRSKPRAGVHASRGRGETPLPQVIGRFVRRSKSTGWM